MSSPWLWNTPRSIWIACSLTSVLLGKTDGTHGSADSGLPSDRTMWLELGSLGSVTNDSLQLSQAI